MKTVQEEKLDVLLEHYRHAGDVKISHRAHVVALHLKGWCVRDVAEATFKRESTVSRWITAFKKLGVGSIFPGYYQNENAAKLTKKQKEEVKQLLRDNPPPDGFWSVGALKEYLSGRFDVTYKSPQSYYGILQLCNYSYKLPSLFNIRRDDEAVDKRIREIREEIKPYMDDPGCIVFASDESRVEWSTLKRRAWLRKGKKTIIKETKGRQYQNYIGFLDLKTGEDLLYRLDWQDQEHIIPVLTTLTETYPNKKLIIIWDNAGFHRGKVIRSQLGPGNPLENIHLIWLPPYAPDKNPQEFVWRHGKDQIANKAYNQFDQLLTTFETSITDRNFNYKF